MTDQQFTARLDTLKRIEQHLRTVAEAAKRIKFSDGGAFRRNSC